MVTRFVPGGYRPEHAGESTASKVSRAVAGLGDLMDDYEFHYPQELSEDNLEDVRTALDGHGIYAVATGTHLNPLFAGTPAEAARIVGPTPTQLCVPVKKNNSFTTSAAIANIIKYSDVLCYNLDALPLDKALKLSHLNPVLKAMGLPPEDVKVTESTKLCVPVAKNGMFPPG